MERGNHYVIKPILPEILSNEVKDDRPLSGAEYSSEDDCMSREQILKLLKDRKLLIEDGLRIEGELLR